jgi:hypothetical protein
LRCVECEELEEGHVRRENEQADGANSASGNRRLDPAAKHGEREYRGAERSRNQFDRGVDENVPDVAAVLAYPASAREQNHV